MDFPSHLKTRSIFRLFISIILAAFILVFDQPLSRARSTDSPLNPYTKVKLANGLTLIVKEVHSVPIAAIDVWVGTGAKNETTEEAGISHFFEHMLFKGTAKRRAGEIAGEIQAVGGYTNAQTSLDTTHYYIVLPGGHVDLAIDIEADAIMNSSFDPEEVDRERKVILEEKRLKEDNPSGRLGLMVYQEVFKGTPYANDILGTAESLGRINHDVFVAYHRRYYTPDNIVVAVVGDVDTGHIVAQVRKSFKDFRARPKPVRTQFQPPKLKEIKRIEAEMEVDQTYLYFGFPGPGMNSKDVPALTILGVILGGGRSSRLYQELQEEKQLVNEISAGYQTYQKIGMMAVYAQTRDSKATDLEAEIKAIISRIIANGVSGDELSRAKALVKSSLAYTMESDADIAAVIGEYQINRDIGDLDRFNRRLINVTGKDIARVAHKYLTPDAYVLAIVKPREVKK